MSKRVFIVHGWDGYPEEGWFPWLKKELEQEGFQVHVPQLPQSSEPRIYNWVPALSKAVGAPDEHTYFVGHSMGCQTIVRYLVDLPDGQNIGGAIFVAGFFSRLTGLEDDAMVQDVATHWLQTSIDLTCAKSHVLKSVAIFSDNDPFVPLDNQDRFRDDLGSEILVVPNAGHFSGSRDQCFELPVALQKMREIASSV